MNAGRAAADSAAIAEHPGSLLVMFRFKVVKYIGVTCSLFTVFGPLF